MSLYRCKHCILPQLPGFIGRAYCRFHWAGQLQGLSPNVPYDMYQEWSVAVANQAIKDQPRLKVKP